MTANSIVYTSSGFVIAADGRCKATDPAGSRERETDEAQKIFPLETKNGVLAYTLSGLTFTEDGRLDVVRAVSTITTALANREFSTSQIYFTEICRKLRHVINAAVKDGTIERFPPNEHLPEEDRNMICRLFIVGYLKAQPIWIIATFSHDEENRITFSFDTVELLPGRSWHMGSTIINNLMYEDRDERFREYTKVLRYDSSIDEAIENALGFIAACSLPLAAELDPLCIYIGGHAHLARAEIFRH
jgi:hypothetical protein